MNTEGFTGKAKAYAKARPGYPDDAVDLIRGLAHPNATYADIGAGTGKFTELLAKHGHEIFAIEPNADMLEQLSITLMPFPNVKIINGTAEATTLFNNSVDVIICSQSLGWFDLDGFRIECHRIGKPGFFVVSIFNYTPGDTYVPNSHRLTSRMASDLFFKNPVVHEFPNHVKYTREKWLQSRASISDNPKPADIGYDLHIAEMNAIFDRENVDGLMNIELVTRVYSERF